MVGFRHDHIQGAGWHYIHMPANMMGGGGMLYIQGAGWHYIQSPEKPCPVAGLDLTLARAPHLDAALVVEPPRPEPTSAMSDDWMAQLEALTYPQS